MSDTNLPAEAGQTPAPRNVREYRAVESRLGIMDSDRFAHLGRVATVMAKAGLMPMSLTHAKQGNADNSPMVELPYEVVQARAFLIANQADLFQMDPNALAQCVSIVHGKLMYEGKLVHALISERLGIDLVYEFGRYDSAKRDILGERAADGEWLGDMPSSADDQGLGVRVIGTLPGELRPRTISGSVAMWHKGPKSPWGSANAWPRQLRYMGAREWCRAYKPSLLLGILTDDEVDEYEAGRQAGAIPASAPPILHAGFSDVRQAELLPPETPAPRKPRTTRAKAAESAPEPREVKEQIPHDSETGEILEGDDLPDHLKTDAKAVAQGGEVIIEGPAPAGVLHFLAGADALDAHGHRLTFKDGARWNTAKPSVDLPTYSELAEIPAKEEPAGNDAATAGAPSAEAEPASSGSATPASGGSPAETSASPPAEGEALPPEIDAYAAQVRTAQDFPTVKAALIVLQKTPLWKEMSNAEADEVRWNTWDLMEASGLAAKVDPAADVSAFRLWVEWCEDPEQIDAMLSKLESHPEFQAKPDATKENIRAATKARLTRLEP